MKSIEVEFAAIEASKGETKGSLFFSGALKKSREWQVLGAIQRQLRAGGREGPFFAEERESPDFALYGSNGQFVGFAEVVEALSPGYRRHQFHKALEHPDAPPYHPLPSALEDPWVTLRHQIATKAVKAYSKSTSLFVYYDIARFAFKDWDVPFHVQLLEEHRRCPFDGVTAFDRVLVLNCDMVSLTELHPLPSPIVEDKVIWGP